MKLEEILLDVPLLFAQKFITENQSCGVGGFYVLSESDSYKH